MSLLDAYLQDKELKDKFLAAIEAGAQLDAMVLAKPDRCELGKWLYGEAERRFKFLKSYKPALEAHAEFHVQAGKVVRQINLREYEDAKALLADGGAYAKALLNMGATLAHLKKEAKL